MRETNSKNEKILPKKKYIFKVSRDRDEAQSLIASPPPPKVHLKFLLHVHTKFQLSSSIWWGDRRGTALFHDQIGEKPSRILP